MSYYVHVYHEVYLPPMLQYSGKVSRDETFANCSISPIPKFQPFLLKLGNDGKVALYFINLIKTGTPTQLIGYTCQGAQ